MKKKRPFILLEIIIAAGLFAFLMSFLLGTFFQWTRLAKTIHTYRTQIEKESLLNERLQSLFLYLLPVAPSMLENKDEEEVTYFYTEAPLPGVTRSSSLIFSFDNRLAPESLFSSTQLARLFINNERQLCLTLWPSLSSHGPETPRTEVLAEQIEEMDLSFYMPPTQSDFDKKIETEELRPHAGEHAFWKREWSILPALVSITLKPVDKPAQKFSFILFQAKLPLMFPVEQIGTL